MTRDSMIGLLLLTDPAQDPHQALELVGGEVAEGGWWPRQDFVRPVCERRPFRGGDHQLHSSVTEMGLALHQPGALEVVHHRRQVGRINAEERGQLVGVLSVSWQVAIRIPGRYGLIQELWVHPGWRGKTIGGDLLSALFMLASRQEITRLEVGLPSERFSHLPATEAFYVNCGFEAIGLRMRRLL